MAIFIKLRGLWSLLQIGFYVFIGCFFFRKRNTNKNKNLLVVTSNFLPEVNGGVYRPLAILRYSNSFDGRVFTLCEDTNVSTSAQARYLLNLIPSSVKIFRAKMSPVFFPYKIGRLFTHSFLQMISMYENARYIVDKYSVGVVLCTGPKFYTFIVGCALKVRYDINLIIDYRDEWSENPFDFVQKSLFDRILEKKSLNLADTVIFTTESQASHCIETFNFVPRKKIQVIHNAIDVDLGAPFINNQQHDGIFRICYTGLLAEFTSFSSFIIDYRKLLEMRPDLRSKVVVEIYGRATGTCLSHIQEFPFKDNLCHLGSKTSSEIYEITCNSNATIMFLNEGFRRYIPGKLFDYISTGKPVLIYGMTGESEVSKLIPDWIKVFNASTGDIVSLESCIDGLLQTENGLCSSFDSNISDFAEKYSREAMAHQFYTILKPL